MSVRLLFTLLFGIAAIARAGDNSVEVTLEMSPTNEQQSMTSTAPHESPSARSDNAQTPFRRWTFTPAQDSDSQFPQWEYKFKAGSDKELGSAADIATIRAMVPSGMPVTIRWVSRHVVAVAADCFSTLPSGSGWRCLYVLEKHGAKWKLTHHYRSRGLGHFPTV